VPVPYAWLDGFGLVEVIDYEVAAFTNTDGDGYPAWEEDVAGTTHLSFYKRLCCDYLLYFLVGGDDAISLGRHNPSLIPQSTSSICLNNP